MQKVGNVYVRPNNGRPPGFLEMLIHQIQNRQNNKKSNINGEKLELEFCWFRLIILKQDFC